MMMKRVHQLEISKEKGKDAERIGNEMRIRRIQVENEEVEMPMKNK